MYGREMQSGNIFEGCLDHPAVLFTTLLIVSILITIYVIDELCDFYHHYKKKDK